MIHDDTCAHTHVYVFIYVHFLGHVFFPKTRCLDRHRCQVKYRWMRGPVIEPCFFHPHKMWLDSKQHASRNSYIQIYKHIFIIISKSYNRIIFLNHIYLHLLSYVFIWFFMILYTYMYTYMICLCECVCV